MELDSKHQQYHQGVVNLESPLQDVATEWKTRAGRRVKGVTEPPGKDLSGYTTEGEEMKWSLCEKNSIELMK